MILTVVIDHQEREWFDIEVPEDCLVSQLKNLLGIEIYKESPEYLQYILEGKFPEGLWFTMNDSHGVTELGLFEGCFIRIQRAFSTTSEEAPVFGRRPLFQQ